MRRTDNERASWGFDLYPFHTLLLKPLEAFVGERVHLVGPRPWSLLMRHGLVILFGNQVSALGNDQATVVGAIWQEVY